MDATEVIASTIRLPRAAKRAGVPERTLRDWIAAGRLEAWKVRGRLHVRPDDVDRLAQPVAVTPPVRAAPAQPLGPSVSSTEAARRLGTTRATVHRLVQSGRLRGEQVGRTLRIEEASIAALERLRPVDTIHAFAALDRLRP